MKSDDDNTATSTGETLLPLVKEIRELVQRARHAASQNINALQVATSFEIGRRIVEYEQKGRRRAEYGERVIRELARSLTDELGRGFSSTNLKYMRQFYREYHETAPRIPPTVSAKSPPGIQQNTSISQTLSDQFSHRFTRRSLQPSPGPDLPLFLSLFH